MVHLIYEPTECARCDSDRMDTILHIPLTWERYFRHETDFEYVDGGIGIGLCRECHTVLKQLKDQTPPVGFAPDLRGDTPEESFDDDVLSELRRIDTDQLAHGEV